MIFTARENFKSEFIAGQRSCQSCNAVITGKTALVVRWLNRQKKPASLALCGETCWENFDHNYWLERAAEREIEDGHISEADKLFDMRLPKYGEKS